MSQEVVISKKINEVVSTSAIPDLSEAEKIAVNYAPLMNKVTEITSVIKTLDKENPKDAAKAKRARLDLGKICSAVKKLKGEDKKLILTKTKFIDALHNTVEGAARLGQSEAEEIEKYQENLEKARLSELQMDREFELMDYVDDPSEYDLSGMKDEVWDAFLQKKIKDFEDLKAAEKEAKEKAEREAKEKKEKEAKEKAERKRLEKKNADLEYEKKKKEVLRRLRSNELKPVMSVVDDYEVLMDMPEEEFQVELKKLILLKEEEEKRKAAASKLADERMAIISPLTDYLSKSVSELIAMSEDRFQDEIAEAEEAKEFDATMDSDPEPDIRASGRTTRLIDKCIQDLFTNKKCTCLDHNDSPGAHQHLMKKVLSRLKIEHGLTSDSVAMNYSKYIIELK